MRNICFKHSGNLLYRASMRRGFSFEDSMQYQMVTANTLSGGAVVYMTKDRNWTPIIDEGWAVPEEKAESLLEASSEGVAEQIVVAPYLIDVAVDGDNIKPARYREQIRAAGPTTMEV